MAHKCRCYSQAIPVYADFPGSQSLISFIYKAGRSPGHGLLLPAPSFLPLQAHLITVVIVSVIALWALTGTGLNGFSTRGGSGLGKRCSGNVASNLSHGSHSRVLDWLSDTTRLPPEQRLVKFIM